MKAKDLRELSLEELSDRETHLKGELFNLRFRHGTNQLESSMRMKQTRRDIARVLTVISQKNRAAAKSEG